MPQEVHDNGTATPESTEEHNSRNSTDHSGNESTQNESRENAADSDLELAWGDCLIFSDMEELAIRMAQKIFWKRVQASCSITRGCLWLGAQVRQIKDCNQSIWNSNQEIRTEVADCSQGGLHTGVRGWGPRPEEDPCSIFETISCSLLPILWKGYNLGNCWPPKGFTWAMLLDTLNVSAGMGL